VLTTLGGVFGGPLVAASMAQDAGGEPNQPVTSTAPTVPTKPDQASRLVGVVVDERGTPLEGVVIQVVPAGPSAGPVPDIAIVTDAQGRFEWPPLSEGRYMVMVEPEGYIPEGQEARLPAKRSAQLTFRMRRRAGQ
jgi:hypothetical protein